MKTGRFYFVSDSFYERFKECGLVDNKIEKNGEEHNRPCCYMFKFDNLPDDEIYWMIPKKLMAELHKKARKKIRFNQQGKRLGLSDTMKIYQELRKDKK